LERSTKTKTKTKKNKEIMFLNIISFVFTGHSEEARIIQIKKKEKLEILL
jgi:hypothetical protein